LQPVQRRTSKVHTAKGGKRVFIWLIVLILIAAGVAIGIVVLQDRSNGGNSGRDRSPDAKAAISSVRPTPDSGLRTGS